MSVSPLCYALRMTNTIEDADLGCWIDGSHKSGLDFNYAVIELAHKRFAYQVDIDMIWNDIQNMENNPETDSYEFIDILDSVYWTCEEALDHMNDSLRDTPYYFEVEDQSLYLARDYEPITLDDTDQPW